MKRRGNSMRQGTEAPVPFHYIFSNFMVDLAAKCIYNTIYISMCGVIKIGFKEEKEA